MGKYLCQSLFFNKTAGNVAYNFIKKEALAQVFSCEFWEIFKNTSSGCLWILQGLSDSVDLGDRSTFRAR